MRDVVWDKAKSGKQTVLCECAFVLLTESGSSGSIEYCTVFKTEELVLTRTTRRIREYLKNVQYSISCVVLHEQDGLQTCLDVQQ